MASRESSPQEHPLCDRNVEKLRAFIRDTEARAKPRPAFCPTRLIRIGDDKGKEDICYLVIPGPDLLRDKRPLRYAALSYCWGPLEDAKAQFKTERASLPDRVSGFRPEETSPVMRDAVEVCRALDIRYLWVDAVCIVQDDRVDWERESAEMTNIYRGACLTICTPTSTSCREGFLERRVLTVNFRSKIDRSVVGSYTIRSCGAISDPRVARGVYGELDRVDTSPLSNWWKRGWTYQELRLSRRVLLFGNKLLVDFENRVWSENDEEMIEVVTGEVSAEGREDRARGAFAGISLTGQFDLGDDWMSTVEEYSARQLTFETDKLPAMAGLARMEVQGGGELYLAGIRRKSVHRDVFWTPEPRTGVAGDGDARVSFDSLIKSLNSPQPYVAPSWSWARWRGKVRFDESPAPYGDHVPVRDGDACFARAYERIDVWTSASESNPFGQVTGGSLKITSTVVPMLPRLQRQEGFDNHWEMYEGNGYVANISFDWDEPEGWVPYERLSLVLIGSYWNWSTYRIAKLNQDAEEEQDDDDTGDEADRDGEADVDMIWGEGGDDDDEDSSSESDISFEAALNRDEDADKFAYGLVVHPAEAEGRYFRVGVFTSWPKGRGGLKRFFQGRDARTIEII
ncbi:HET-domain-containing protein [Durotheca rogersii]|uniref:HET-domain-containing protein n=1 Tax=Durotheca rogersii TaxID=419775 RepID=UPI002221012F|nr:HET-domain-containing protein [Durotheca rogersii]KAI5861309.1 HET-domain-containing protein [Durotheca rogersii]